MKANKIKRAHRQSFLLHCRPSPDRRKAMTKKWPPNISSTSSRAIDRVNYWKVSSTRRLRKSPRRALAMFLKIGSTCTKQACSRWNPTMWIRSLLRRQHSHISGPSISNEDHRSKNPSVKAEVEFLAVSLRYVYEQRKKDLVRPFCCHNRSRTLANRNGRYVYLSY